MVRSALERIGVQLIGGTVQTQGIEVLARAQIRQQQKSALHVARQDGGHIEIEAAQDSRHLQERTRIFLVGRRIHHNVGIRVAGHAKIAAKARVHGRGCDRCAAKTQILDHPLRQVRQAGIACIQYIHA